MCRNQLFCAFAIVVIIVMSDVVTGTTLATLTSFTAHGAVTTHGALRTLGTGTTLALYITLGLLYENTAREFELTGLGVNLQEFYLQLVTFLDTGLFHGLQTLPVYLADVQQTVLAWHELNEATIRHY